MIEEFKVYNNLDELMGYETLDEDGRWFHILESEGVKRTGVIAPPIDETLYRFPYINKKDIEGDKIYANSSILVAEYEDAFKYRNVKFVCGVVKWNSEKYKLDFNYKTELFYTNGDLQRTITDNIGMNKAVKIWKNFKIIGTIQKNTELMEKK